MTADILFWVVNNKTDGWFGFNGTFNNLHYIAPSEL